jgi:hypothetical protein
MRNRIIEVIDKDGEPQNIEVPITTTGLPLKRLHFESYFISKGYVTLSFAELRALPARYAGLLYMTLQTIDKIAAEKQREEMERSQRRT